LEGYLQSAVDYFGILGKYNPETKKVTFLEERVVFTDGPRPEDAIMPVERYYGTQTVLFWDTTSKAAKQKVLAFFR
jgi:hypothetical protein